MENLCNEELSLQLGIDKQLKINYDIKINSSLKK